MCAELNCDIRDIYGITI
ncbi:hypothetical protein [Robinsoniella peoriensis]